MAAPVGNQHPPIQPHEPARPLKGPAPLGNGGAPTTMQPAAAPAPRDVGYVETAVLFIKDLIVKLFSMIFCCFRKAEEPPVQLPPAAPAPAQAEPELPRLIARVQDDIDLLNEFSRLPEEVQNRIYIRIGQDRHAYWFRRGSDLEAGRTKVQDDPRILLQYIVRPTH